MDKKKEQKKGHFALCFKEFKFCAIATMAYILISCIICWFTGYSVDGSQVSFIMGIPSWAVFGVFIPWIIMVIVTAVYGFVIMEGDEEE